MKRLLSLIFMLLATLSMSAKEITLADPTIYCEDGVYYLTGTLSGDGFKMYKSTDLVHWSPCGNATGGLALYKDDTFGTQGFWAPQIFRHEGNYYMAYTANELIAIAQGEGPEGPFRQDDVHELPHDTGQIDPFVFIDDDGRKYMYYVRFDGGNSLYVCELTDDFSSIKEGTVTKCLEASNAWEQTGYYSNAKITEGPTMFKDGDYYYLIYSANDFRDINYAVGYAFSTSPMGPWTKASRPFISRHNIGINGTGHGDLFRDADGQLYYVFHVHASNTQVQTRRTAIVPIEVTSSRGKKFVPQVDRMWILDDAASSTAKIPEAATYVEVDGVNCYLPSSGRKTGNVTFKDPVLFGGYRGTVNLPEVMEVDGKEYKVSVVGHNAFYNATSLKTVNLTSNITTIGVSAFEASGISSITLPESVVSVGYRAFADCSKLLTVTVERATPPGATETSFSETTTQQGTLYVPAGTKEKYAAATGWSQFVNIVEQEATAIEVAPEMKKSDNAEYNLSGIKHSGTGVIIKNGKKYLK